MGSTKNFFIDKSDWIKVKFGDVVFEPKESIKDPIAEGIVHVVGLEHIDSGDIHLRHSARIEEGTTFTKKFIQGDVLFGRRRAYLKKAAKANFEGICSGDITLFRAKKELLNPELLPFIVKNENFFDHAITHSAGGLSPRVKFKDLANYEFLLPPTEQHAEIAELLWSVDKVIQEDLKVLKTFENLLYAKTKSFFQDSQNKIKIEEIVIDRACKKAEVGLSPYIEIGDIDTFNKKITFKDKKSVKGSIIASQDSVLVSKVRPYRGAVHILKEDQIVSNGFSVLNVNTAKLSPSFLFYCIAWNKDFYYQMSRLSAGSTYPTVEDEDILGYSIPYVGENLQKEYVEKICQIYKAFSNIESKINKTKNLLNVLVNQIF